MSNLFNKHTDEDHNFWMSYTDLMSGFLAVFIIISMILYYQFDLKTKEAERTEQQYNVRLLELERVLDSIKKNDLKNQIMKYKDVFVYDDNVKVDFNAKRGSIILTHRNPNCYLFKQGESSMQPELRRYLDRIGKSMVLKTISIWEETGNKDMELRIEGHTDPTWRGKELRGTNISFTENLRVSSDRANNVYEYILYNTGLTKSQQDFVKKNMISIGYSFSSRVRQNNVDDPIFDDESRRIEIRIISK